MARDVFLGIDGGGTKTMAVLLDERCHEIARVLSGSSNVHSVGLAATETSLREAIRQILIAGGVKAVDVTAVGLGLAGAARPEDRQVVRELLARIAPFRNVIVTHDAEAALVGSIGRRQGALLIAGTGAMAYGVNARGESRRADGWGYRLGDEGSAHWIGLEGLRALVRAHDGRGPGTALADRLLSHLDLPNTDALVTRIYASDVGVPQVAALAPLVSEAARVGDPVAQGILREAGQRLGETLCAVVCGLGMSDQTFEVVLLGGVLRARDLVWQTVVAALSEVAPQASVVEPRHDAAVGAALLARELEIGESKVEANG
jgi:N-acetylglucosamine kinase-like BadF-type ATPase